MGREFAKHLDEDEFSLAVLGEALSAEAQAHVSGCEICRAEMERFKVSVGDFGVAALRWSEAQQGAATPARATRWWMYPAAAWSLAGGVLLGVAVPVTVHFEHARGAVETAANVVADESPEQIAKDNALLAAVNDELSKSDAQMLAAHGWQGEQARGAKGGMRGRRR